LYAGFISIFVGTIPLVLIYRYCKKMKKLKKDREIME